MQSNSSLTLKSFISPLRVVIAGFLFTAILSAPSQQVRFFRIVGPTAATITSFQPDGSIIWGNALAGSTYTVQTAASLPGGTNWVDYVQLPVTNTVNANKLVDFSPPPGMALVPAGSFTMGNSIGDTDITDAPPVTVKVSAFYMEQAGRTPAHFTDAGLTQVYTNGQTDAVRVNWNVPGYRLTTEAEWEKAARAGLGGLLDYCL